MAGGRGQAFATQGRVRRVRSLDERSLGGVNPQGSRAPDTATAVIQQGRSRAVHEPQCLKRPRGNGSGHPIPPERRTCVHPPATPTPALCRFTAPAVFERGGEAASGRAMEFYSVSKSIPIGRP